MDYALLPKVELHLHLDCCLSYKVVQQLDSSISFKDYQESFIAPAKCPNLADYITRAVKGVELMQTQEQIRCVTLDLFEQLRADNVVYAEIRFAPLQHTANGLSPEAVVEAVIAATKEGMVNYGIEAGIILCTLRHYAAAQSLQTVKLVKKYKGTCVVGFDIAADEAGYPTDNHREAFAYAKENDIPCTAHAGEARGAESVWETLAYFFPRRIGHGVRSMEDPELVRHLLTHDIHLEVCVTSNLQTNIYQKVEDHTVDAIYQSGISMGLNTDARTISNTNLAGEYDVLGKAFGWGKAHFLHCNLEAIRQSFASAEIKAKITRLLLEQYNLNNT